ncbi:MAG TPA: CocE/NonD family hydrolase [Roseiflexaceae bacterium]|nr:CocE/NonD family hydrolase [Roseiflexaceae bacterium]
MAKRSLIGLLGLAALGALAYTQRRAIPARLLRLPPAKYKIAVRRNLRVPMPDGVELAADHYAPQSAAGFPTILIRTPYSRGGLNALIARLFAERGYNVVAQDVRGRFDSQGMWEPYVHEGMDGAATLDWIAQQPWFDGQAAMWGPSYVGFVQWAAAASGSSHLRALLPMITEANLGPVWEHGLRLDRTLHWLLTLDAQANPELSRWEKLKRAWRAEEQDRVLAPGFAHLPLATVDEAMLGKPVPFYRTWVEHFSADDPYWRTSDYRAAVPNIDLPAHFIGGWYDIFITGTLRDYHVMRKHGRNPYLTIGPWTHINASVQIEGVQQGLAWFDAHLKGDRSRLRAKPVRLFVMGADEWREFDAWPPDARETRFFLQPHGGLAPATPPADAAPDQYRYDPADPTPNIAGPLLSAHAGPRDNRPLEQRRDVLWYSTPPLEQPVEIIGPVRLELWVKSSLEHTDFFGRLCDAHPDGCVINICDGYFRVQPGRGERHPDGSLRLVIDFDPTAHRFLAGHCMRLIVASAAFPRAARNLGTGEPLMTGTRMLAADQTIFHDTARPSALALPVLPAT